MKKMLVMLLSGLIITASFAGCQSSKSNETTASVPESSIAEEPSQELPEEPGEDEPDVPVAPVPPIADTAMYRGDLVELHREEDQLILVLEQAEGTDFGAQRIQVAVTESTAVSFDPETLEAGQYLEVYHNSDLESEETVNAIMINQLAESSMSIYNGTLTEWIVDEDDDTAGSFLLQAKDSEDTILFHYTDETQFYLNRDDISEGDMLNVYFSGITTRSIPPQATAMEVRLYK